LGVSSLKHHYSNSITKVQTTYIGAFTTDWNAKRQNP